ncbi:hypothetical protein INR49_030012 [Caranx melampygus]|nr:hypothetical protein INR49_030012 [Caranx melampygus]
MRWFDGSIPDAINFAKQQSFVFVVVITGEDEQSAQLMSSWEDDQVSEAALNCCVAIRVDAKSETCVQFSQIYPVVCIPSSFFIGENGIPLEVIAGSVSAEELMKRINRVKQMHAQQIGGATVSPEASPPLETSPHNSTPTEPGPDLAPDSVTGVTGRSAAEATETAAVPGTAKASLSNPADDGSPSAAQCAKSEENLDTKVERLTKKLEERREQRKKGEEENEIKKEMERRKMGKDMQDFKRKQEEEKTKRLLEERNREKAEEKAARERVKQQIAMDRADRAVRYAKTQEEEKAAREALLQARQAEQKARREAVEVGNRYGNFSLATMFPRREFTEEDMDKTLQELQLAPSASIVLLPHSGRPANTVVHSFLFPASPPPGAASPAPTQQSSSSYTASSSSSASDKTKREPLSKTTVEKRPKHFKKEGKICRLRTQEDSEDDNNTWNGNSTQQM